MTETLFDEARRLADRLSPLDQMRLMEYILPRVAHAVSSRHSTPMSHTDAWRDFFRIGNEVVASDTPTMDTLTAAVLAMRR